MSKDIHKKPFDEGTIVKLALYRRYLKEWLPVFLSKVPPQFTTINIYDFFSGPGMDTNGEKGSPLITIDLLAPYFEKILTNKQRVNLHFNDKRKSKIKQLKDNIKSIEIDLSPLNIHYYSEEFQKLFNKSISSMSKSNTANFLFLDQSGIKNITDDIFNSIITLPVTDFLFFISSSTLHRFNDHPEINKYIKIDKSGSIESKYCHVHREVLEYYRSLIPAGKEYYLAPFSIKKNVNIYGLIFGTGHLLGIEKFLKQCWKIDTQTGESNFDIDDDRIHPSKPYLFDALNKPRKLDAFENDIKSKILKGDLKTNKDIYIYTLSNGFLAEHVRMIIKKLIRESELPKQKINISYNSCIIKNDVKELIYN
jgi:three-Cys-motif partner protein